VKICVCVITWQQPLLGRLIECFGRQSHDAREMLIIDDAGWYPDQPHGDRWRVVSIDRRFSCLGAKRNAAAALASSNCGAFCIGDDDDVYLSHWLASIDHALQSAAWCAPTQALEWNSDGTWRRQLTWRGSPLHRAYHGAWAFRREAFEAVGGYPIFGEEDIPLARQLIADYGPPADPICSEFPDPYYAYSRGPDHISESYIRLSKERDDYHAEAYRRKGLERRSPVPLVVGWDRNYSAIPIPAEVHPRPW